MDYSFRVGVSENRAWVKSLYHQINTKYKKDAVEVLKKAGGRIGKSIEKEYRRNVRHAYGSDTKIANVIKARFIESNSPTPSGKPSVSTVGSIHVGFAPNSRSGKKWVSIAYQREFGQLLDGSNTILPRRGKVMAIPPTVRGNPASGGEGEAGVQAGFDRRLDTQNPRSETSPGIFGGEKQDKYNQFSRGQSPRNFKGYWRKSSSGNIVFIRELSASKNKNLIKRRHEAYTKAYGQTGQPVIDSSGDRTSMFKPRRDLVVRKAGAERSRDERQREKDDIAASSANRVRNIKKQSKTAREDGISRVQDVGQGNIGNEFRKKGSAVDDPETYTAQQLKLNTYVSTREGDRPGQRRWNKDVTVYERQPRSLLNAQIQAAKDLDAIQHVANMKTSDLARVVKHTVGKKRKQTKDAKSSLKSSHFMKDIHELYSAVKHSKVGKGKAGFDYERIAMNTRTNAKSRRAEIKRKAERRTKYLKAEARQAEEAGHGEVLFIGKTSVKIPSYAESPKFLLKTLRAVNVGTEFGDSVQREYRRLGISVDKRNLSYLQPMNIVNRLKDSRGQRRR